MKHTVRKHVTWSVIFTVIEDFMISIQLAFLTPYPIFQVYHNLYNIWVEPRISPLEGQTKWLARKIYSLEYLIGRLKYMVVNNELCIFRSVREFPYKDCSFKWARVMLMSTLCKWLYDDDCFKMLVAESWCWHLFSLCRWVFQYNQHPSPTSMKPSSSLYFLFRD